MSNGQAQIKYLYAVQDGCCTEEHYGLQVARIAGLTESVLQRAHVISVKLELNLMNQKEARKAQELALKASHVPFVKRLKAAKEAWTGTPEGLLVYIKGLLEDYKEQRGLTVMGENGHHSEVHQGECSEFAHGDDDVAFLDESLFEHVEA
jgi:hypothetical protein